MIFASGRARALQNSQSPAGAVRGGDAASMEPARFLRCSVLLTFQRISVLVTNEAPAGSMPSMGPKTAKGAAAGQIRAEQIRHYAVVE